MLYLVATSIGNYEDMSFHAVEILKQVDLVACEDTRVTGQLLSHFGIKKPLLSFFEHNEEQRMDTVIGMIAEGKSVALVSDRGSPCISDPGYRLVRKAVEQGVEFSFIPGPSAFLMALVLSGLPVHSFLFKGFPPRKPGKRRKFVEVDKELPYTLIYYESPHRLLKFLTDAFEVLGDRHCCIANDLTKKYEAVQRGRLSEIISYYTNNKVKGEFTVVIEGNLGDNDEDNGEDNTVE